MKRGTTAQKSVKMLHRSGREEEKARDHEKSRAVHETCVLIHTAEVTWDGKRFFPSVASRKLFSDRPQPAAGAASGTTDEEVSSAGSPEPTERSTILATGCRWHWRCVRLRHRRCSDLASNRELRGEARRKRSRCHLAGL